MRSNDLTQRFLICVHCWTRNKSTPTWQVQPLCGKCGWKFPRHKLSYKPCSFAFSTSPNNTNYEHHPQIHEIPAADLVPTTQNLEKAVCDVCVIFLALKAPSLCRGAITPDRKDCGCQVASFQGRCSASYLQEMRVLLGLLMPLCFSSFESQYSRAIAWIKHYRRSGLSQISWIMHLGFTEYMYDTAYILKICF